MAVKEKLLQGGGLGPVVGGEDHLPEEGKVTLLAIIMDNLGVSATVRKSIVQYKVYELVICNGSQCTGM